MDVNELLNAFSKTCSKKLNLQCIMQFGSSTYSKEFNDIDLVFFSEDKVFSAKDYIKLFSIFAEFEEKYPKIAFDIAGGKGRRKTAYSISVIPLQQLDLDLKIDPFFLKNLSEDEHKKILFGIDPTNLKVKLSKAQIAERLSLERNHNLRACVSEETRNESVYTLFKTTLRLMLANKGVPEKGELLSLFAKEYMNISLPENAANILKKKMSVSDFEGVLNFSEECILFLVK